MAEPLQTPESSPPRNRRRFWLAAFAILGVGIWVFLAMFLLRLARMSETANQAAGSGGSAGTEINPFDSSDNNWLEQPSQPVAIWDAPGVGVVEGDAVVAARHEHVVQSSAELLQLTEAHRDALALLVKALAERTSGPPNALLEQLEVEQQSIESQLAAEQTLAKHLIIRQQWLDRLDRLEADIAKKPGDAGGKSLDLAVCRAARAEAALRLAQERYRDQRALSEVLILEDEVGHLHEIYTQIDALYRVGERGGESQNWARAGFALCRARAELARACGDRPAALAHWRETCEFGANLVENYGVNMGGPPDWTPTEPAQARYDLTTARLELLRYARLLGDRKQMEWAEFGRNRP